jgi:hypothetical protein
VTDPERLRDKYMGELEGSLLASAEDDAPSGRARGRTLAALGFGGLAASLPTATTSVAAAKTVSSLSLAVAVKWGTIGLAAGALTVGGIHEAPRWIGARDEAKAAALHRAPKDSPEPAMRPRPEEETLPQPEIALPSPEPAAPAAVLGARSNPEAVPRAPSPLPLVAPLQDKSDEPKLAEEVAALDRARHMVSLRPEAAIALLDAYDRDFPRGDLAPEALVLRIDALVRSGKTAAAAALGGAYLSAHPRSPHADRIRAMLGQKDESR